MNPTFRNLLITATRNTTEALKDRADVRDWVKTTQRFAQVTTGQSLNDEAVYHQVALAAIAAQASLTRLTPKLQTQTKEWLKSSSHPLWRRWLAICLDFVPNSDHLRSALPQTPYLLETLLSLSAASERRRRGVYYTPVEVVDFILKGVSELASSVFDKQTLSKSEFKGRGPHFLDPAIGSGVFLTRTIHLLHARFDHHQVDWSQYVRQTLLQRLSGWDIMLSACIATQVEIAVALAETGFNFTGQPEIDVELVNTLRDSEEIRRDSRSLNDEQLIEQALLIAAKKESDRYTVILGNPPFSGISANDSEWSRMLLRGTHDESPRANYFEVDGKPLGERKVWLNDDYAKFIRYSHWLLEKSGSGLVGFVTNHSFLDSASYRGMRFQLQDYFDHLTVIDLHGNAKRSKVSPDDENVFEIAQGVGILLAAVHPATAASRQTSIHYGSLKGTRVRKLDALRTGTPKMIATTELSCDAPRYLFVKSSLGRVPSEWRDAWPIQEAMPVSSSAVVTARDRFVTDVNRSTLSERLESFRCESIADAEIRATYFTRGRSHKYPPGDTRSWKLAEARESLRNEQNHDDTIRTCWYRPFDRRWITWDPRLIDWPRLEVSRHMLTSRANWALITRRQMVPGQPCNFMWVTDGPVIDGLIRSDNRGNESFFPLWLLDDPAEQRPNFSAAFLAAARELDTSPRLPQLLFGYIYALFHSNHYRTQYAEQLYTDFPRVILPNDSGQFRTLARLGWKLIRSDIPRLGSATVPHSTPPTVMLSSGFPKYRDGQLQWSSTFSTPLAPAIWEFRVGSHHVCRKWLTARKGQEFNSHNWQQWLALVNGITQHIHLQNEIDKVTGV